MKAVLLLGLGALLISMSCSTLDVEEQYQPVVKEEGDKILIVDQTGKEWDITHAVENYGMGAGGWQFGLGPNTIRPIIDPQYVGPGDRGFPDPNKEHIVIGTTIGGDSRAYSIDDLNAHEVVDDVFGDVHVAVGW
jgi:hypothetical protein